MAAFEGSYPVSGTYAQPGADVLVVLGSTSIRGITGLADAMRIMVRIVSAMVRVGSS